MGYLSQGQFVRDRSPPEPPSGAELARKCSRCKSQSWKGKKHFSGFSKQLISLSLSLQETNFNSSCRTPLLEYSFQDTLFEGMRTPVWGIVSMLHRLKPSPGWISSFPFRSSQVESGMSIISALWILYSVLHSLHSVMVPLVPHSFNNNGAIFFVFSLFSC